MDESKSSSARRDVIMELRALAAAQGGVFSREQITAAGLSQRRILRWAEDGLFTKVFRGTYSLDAAVTRLGERWAAHLSIGPHSVIAADTAIDALGLISVRRRPVHLVVPGRRPPRPQRGVVVHERSSVHDDDIVELDGEPPCSSAASMLVDIADPMDPARLDRVLDRAVHLRRFDARAAEAVLKRRKASPKTRALIAAIERLDETSGRNRTELERLVIALIRDSHLPPVINNARIGPWEVDVLFPRTRAIVEADGGEFHSSPAQIAADIAKREALEAYGFKIKRVNWEEANYNTDRTIDSIDRFRLANQAPPVPGPPVEIDLSTRRNGR